MKRKEFTLPTLIGLLLATVGLVTGLWLVQRQRNQSVQAESTGAPSEVKVANVSDTGFNVSWITNNAMAGFIQYGENLNVPDVVVSDERDQQNGSVDNYFTHFVSIKGLKPGTLYTFKIGSGKGLYDNDGKNYQVTTGAKVANQPVADVAYGQVVTASGEPADGALVYAQLPGAGLLAGLVKASGSWVIPLSTARTLDGSTFVNYDKSTKINIAVADGSLGKASSVTTAGGVSPVPQMTLGKTYDFTANVPAASESATASKFSQINAAWEAQTNSPTKIRILTPKLGEQINSSKPQIQGEAPAGTKVTLEIHSGPTITATVVTGKDGKFSYSVPTDLTPGDHTLTITALIDGITQTITRSFTVYAVGGSNLPTFSATPSATLKPSPKPTATPTPVPTTIPTGTPKPTVVPTGAPTISPTIKPTPRPTAVPTPMAATNSAIPVSGSTDWTWLTLIWGAGMLLSGAWWYSRTDG